MISRGYKSPDSIFRSIDLAFIEDALRSRKYKTPEELNKLLTIYMEGNKNNGRLDTLTSPGKHSGYIKLYDCTLNLLKKNLEDVNSRNWDEPEKNNLKNKIERYKRNVECLKEKFIQSELN